MTRAEFEAELVREGYEIREGEIKPHVHREAHAHEFDASVLVLDGSITLVFGTDRVTYGPGDSCKVPAGTFHEEHTDAAGVRYLSGRRPVPRTLPTPSQRISPQKFAHVVLKTANFDVVIDWYATVLQARVAFRNDFIAFLTYDDEHHRVAVINNPGSPAPDAAAAGVHHIAYTYAGLGELLTTYRRLKARGIEPARCINHGPTISMYYRDPDGLRVELQVDVFATMAEANAYLTGPEFAENPIGVIFDPEQMIRDYEAGRAVDDLVRRPPLPPGKTPMDMRAETPR